MKEESLPYRLYAYKETILIVLLCGASLIFARGGALLSGLTGRLLGLAPLVLTLALPVCEDIRFTPVLGAVGVLFADFLFKLLPLSGLWGLVLFLTLAAAAAFLLGWLAGLLEALMRAEQRGLVFLSSLVTGCFFLGLSMLVPSGGADFASLKAVLGGITALQSLRVLFAAVVAAAFALMLIRSARKARIPFPALAAVLLIAGIGMALTFLPGLERILMQSSYSLYFLLLLICGAAAPFQLMKLLLFLLVYKRAYSLRRGLFACMLAAAVFLFCCLPHHADMLEGIALPAAPLLLAGCMIVIAAAAPHKSRLSRHSPCAFGDNGRSYKRPRAGALTAVAAVPAYILLALNAGALPQAPQIANETLYAMAALLVVGAGRSCAGRAALGAPLFFTLQSAAPLASALLYGSRGIGEGFVHLLALGMVASAAARQCQTRLSQTRALMPHPPSVF